LATSSASRLWQFDLIHSAEDHAERTIWEMHFWHRTMFVLNSRPAGALRRRMETSSPGAALTLMLTPDDED
jgi:hypothetical protein